MDEKIILHVEDYFDPEAGYQVNELLKIKSKGIKQILITSYDMSPFHKEYDKNKDEKFELKYNIRIVRLKVLFKISSRLVLSGLLKEIHAQKPDLLFMHGIGDFKDIYLFKRKLAKIVIRDCHMSWVASQNKFAKIFLFLYSITFAKLIRLTTKYDKIFALGVEERQYLAKMGIPNGLIDGLPHGYNKLFFYFDPVKRLEIRKRINLKNDDLIIAYIGKLDYHKKPHLLFNIISNIDNNILYENNIRILFIGSSEKKYKIFFQEELNNFKLKHTTIEIIFLNALPFEELANWYSTIDICIWPQQTTLSSIHAQICQAVVIMEKQLSNFERVINKDNLFNIGDFKHASEILERNILNKEYYIKNKLIDEDLLNREYSSQFSKLTKLIHEHNV